MWDWRKWIPKRQGPTGVVSAAPGASPFQKPTAGNSIGTLFRARHLAIDLCERGIVWALATEGFSGFVLRKWGWFDRTPGQDDASLLSAFAATPLGRAARLEVSLDSNSVGLKRVELPPVNRRELDSIAMRRLSEFARESDEATVADYGRSRMRDSRQAWLSTLGVTEARECQETWTELGPSIHRVTPRPIALGYLASLMPPPAEGELNAVCEVKRGRGLAVLVDEEGWVFSRSISFKFAGDRMMRVANDDGIELAGDDQSRDGVHSDLARIVTELERTFRYAQGELGLGAVSRIVLSGDLPELEPLAEELRKHLKLEVSIFGEAFEDGPAAGADPAASTAIALCLAPGRRGSNLLPGQARERLRALAQRKALVAALVTSLGAIAVATSVGAVQVYRLEDRAEQLARQWEAGAEERSADERDRRSRGQARHLRETMATIERSEPPWPTLFDVMGRLAPPDLSVAELDAEYRHGVWEYAMEVDAVGDSMSEAVEHVADFSRVLGDTPLFTVKEVRRVRTSAPNPDLEQGEVGVRFHLTGQVAVLAREAPGDGEVLLGGEALE